MSAAVVRREQLDVFVVLTAVDLVLDAVVREMYLATEVREVVLARPVTDLVVAAVRAPVAVCSPAVVVLQERLVLALEILLEDYAADLEIRMLVSETGFLLAERRVEVRIVLDLAGATDASMESLLASAVALQGVRVKQIASLSGEGQGAFVAAKSNCLDKALVAEMAERIVLRVDVVFGHDPERADDGQRAALLAVQLVYAVAIDNELAFLSARQVEILHQTVARLVIVSVPLAVDARAAIAAIRIVVLAGIVPSSVRHRPSFGAQLAPVGLSVKTPWQCLRRAVQGSAEPPGRVAAAISAWSEETLVGTVTATRPWARLACLGGATASSRPETA